MSIPVLERPAEGSVDLLNRQGFVKKVLNVSQLLSENKKNACYAINGSWGSGKTFVLDMLEKQAREIRNGDDSLYRYIVLHYNCWEYDYYEEPLLAIVATIQELLDKEVNFVSQKNRDKIKGIIKVIAKGFRKKATEVIEDKTGVSLKELLAFIDEVSDEVKESETDYDPYTLFKASLRALQKAIRQLAEEQTILVVVDELDRCLPEYTIKVMERLHHLFTGIPNVQVLLAVDKKQLAHTVQRIYGPSTNVKQYLAKFINFEISLPIGSFGDPIAVEEAFQDYYNLFEYRYSFSNQKDVRGFCSILFDDIDVRSRIEIYERACLLHGYLSTRSVSQDFCLLCIELFLCVLKHVDVDISEIRKRFPKVGIVFFSKNPSMFPKPLDKLSSKYAKRQLVFTNDDDGGRCYDIASYSIWDVIYATYLAIVDAENNNISLYLNDYVQGHFSGDEVISYARSFWALLQTIN